MMVPPRLQIRTSRIQWSHLRYSLELFSWWVCTVSNKVRIELYCWDDGSVLTSTLRSWEADARASIQGTRTWPRSRWSTTSRGISTSKKREIRTKQGMEDSRWPPCKSSRRGGRRWRCPLCPTGCEKGQGDHWEGKCLRLQISAWIHLSYIVQLPP